MPRSSKAGVRPLSTFVFIIVGVGVLVVGWAAWGITSSGAITEAEPPASTVAAFSTLPAPNLEPADEQSNTAFVGAPAPDFSLAVFDTGETVRLSGLRGQPVILDFFASWCPSCRAEAPFLQQFWQAYQDKGLSLLGVALNDGIEGLRDFKDEFGLTYPMGLDVTGEIAAMYRVGGIPTFVMIDREGRIANVVVGAMGEAAMAAEAEALLE